MGPFPDNEKMNVIKRLRVLDCCQIRQVDYEVTCEVQIVARIPFENSTQTKYALGTAFRTESGTAPSTSAEQKHFCGAKVDTDPPFAPARF
jgi:hypothetical protein